MNDGRSIRWDVHCQSCMRRVWHVCGLMFLTYENAVAWRKGVSGA